MSEKNIRRAIVAYLNGLPNCYARSMHGGAYSGGLLDIFGSYKGRTLVIECKLPGNLMTRLQEVELAKWKEAGAIVGCVHSVEEARSLIKIHAPQAMNLNGDIIDV